MKVTRVNEFRSSDGKAEELFDFLKSLKTYIASSAGCESCEVLQNCDDENLFLVLETWDSVDAHKESLAKYPKEKMAAAMSLIGGPPKGSFYHA